MAISHCYYHLVVMNGNFTLLLTSRVQKWQFHIATDIYGHEWQFHIATSIHWPWMAISQCDWHWVVIKGNFTFLLTSNGKNGNFTLLLTSIGHEWQYHIATDILWLRMAISHCYWHLVVKNGNFTLVPTLSGQQRQLHIPTDIQW